MCLAAWSLACVLSAPAGTARAADNVGGTMITVNDNGGWSWFEDERAVVDVAANKLLVASIANSSGFGGAARSGDVEIASVDLTTAATSRFLLHDNLQASDDHNSPAIWIRPDGRYVTMFGTHLSDALSRWRVSTNPGDISSWTAEQSFTNAAAMTYSNLYYLPNDNGGAGRLYNFTRSIGFDPNILVSNDLGSTWSYGGRLLTEGGDSDRPYLRYNSDGNKIWLMSTDRHPRDFNNSIYAGYIQDGKLYNSTGTVIDANLFDATGMAPNQLTHVFDTNTVVGGVSMQRGWTLDVSIDGSGNPVGVFQMRANGSNQDHRFFYTRFDGSQWQSFQMGYAGSSIYAVEDDYTGIASIDPKDPSTVYISSEVNPVTQAQLIGADGARHYELFRGHTPDSGATWTWAPLTFNSTVDNIRPLVPKWDASHTAVVWMRGHYTTYVDYNMKPVTLLNPSIADPVPALSVDFGSTGQLVQSGFSAFTRDENPAGTSQTEMYSSSFANGGGQISVTVGGGDVQFRDRGDNVAGPIGDLQDDFVFNAGTLTLTLGNLQAGDYQLVLYGHDRDFAQAMYRVMLGGSEIGRMTPTTGASPLVGTASSRVQFHANGASDVVFSLESLTAANVTLNGFELYSASAYVSPPTVDLNGDGVLNFADYQQYIGGMHKNLTGMSASVAYSMGDLNGDLANNYTDLLLFRQAYNQANGLGAFEAAFGVPEPGAAALAMVGVVVLAIARRRMRAPLVAGGLLFATTIAGIDRAQAELAMGWGMEPTSNDAAVTEGVPGSFMTTTPGSDPVSTTNNVAVRAVLTNAYSLANVGDNVLMTGVYTPSTAISGNQQFRFGLFNTNGHAPGTLTSGTWVGADPAGWLGYQVQLGNSGSADAIKGRATTGSWFSNTGATNSLGGVAVTANPAGGVPYNLSLQITRISTSTLEVTYSFAGGTAPVVSRTATVSDPTSASAAMTAVNAVGFFGTNGGSGGAMSLTGVTVEVAHALRLRVNTTTGFVSIANMDAATTFTPSYYEISSTAGSLSPTTWMSIDGDVPASTTTWEKAGGSSANILSETNLLGSLAVPPQGPNVALGKAFNTSGIVTQDLAFRYGLPGGGPLQTGFVEYVSGGPAGDFDVDGDVDGQDFLTWERGLGTGYTAAHLTDWRNTFGQTSVAGSAGVVPEPTAIFMACMGVAARLLAAGGRGGRVGARAMGR